ncbi:hypothetical protein DSO57_1039669 [Entomophthora muscae]|uniref:Uncharacterized protein n=1 Tax=Entomophthora muscae TaxID=34485 RepID=A0ACC2TN29_9FUNG|nr:hypothetical protein DSO57_1039669 [Entomophthora muscae]
MEYNPLEYYQHPLPVLALVGLKPPASDASPTNSAKELGGKDQAEGQDAEISNQPTSKHPLTASKTSTSQLLEAVTKKITELLGVDLPPSLWEPGRIVNNSLLTGPANFGICNRNPSINIGAPNLMASSERAYNAILGDKGFIFPSKRIKSVAGVASTHSVLSPLSPVSPLHPDGLMTPLWIRRHFLDYPGAIIAFFELWLPTEEGGSQQDRLSQSFFQGNGSNPSWREKDAALAGEINDARKAAGQNNIKFAAVIWNLSRHDGEDVMIERLTTIRKGSGLDARNGFFVLDRRNADNLTEFMAGILKVINDPSLQRYRDHYRRIKRKLARFSSHPPINPPALNAQGWTFRYEFKLGYFCLVRGDAESATSHFEAAYCDLSELLCDNNVGKRWDDASSLIDSVSFQICRAYFYQGNGHAALLQLQRHMRGFGPLLGATKRNLWMAQQFRLFADLLDWAVRSGKSFDFGQRVPVNQPIPPAGLFQLGSQISWRRSIQAPLDDAPGIYPLGVLHHPGYYYYEAARNLTGPDQSQPVIEALSKSYEQFKRNHGNRMTLKVASAIADAYLQSNKYDLAIKFYDRIAKAYRKEPWPQLLCAALQQALVCAQKLGSRDTLLRHSIELLSPSFAMDTSARQELLAQLLATLELPCENPQLSDEQRPDTPRSIEIDMLPASSFLAVSAGFGCSTAVIQKPILLQVYACASLYPDADFQVSSVDVAFSDPSLNFSIANDPTMSEAPLLEVQDRAPLRLKHGLPLVLQKTLAVNQAIDLKVASLTFHITSAAWDLALKYDLLQHATSFRAAWATGANNGELLREMFPIGVDPLTCRVHLPPPLLKLQVAGPNPAYLNEACPVDIHLHSDEAEPIEVTLGYGWMDAQQADQIHIEPPSTTSLAPESIACGTLEANADITKRLYVVFNGKEGIRSLHIKVHVNLCLTDPQAQYTRKGSTNQTSEVVSMLKVDVLSPFKCHFKCYPLPGFSCVEASSLFQSLVPSQNLRRKMMLTSHLMPAETLLVHRLELVTRNNPNEVQVLSPGLSDMQLSWEGQSTRLINYMIETSVPIASASDPHPKLLLNVGHLKIQWQRHDSAISEFLIPIPPVELPPLRIAVELSI